MSGIKKINLADNAVSKETLYNDGDIAIGNSLRGSEGEDAFMFDFHVMVLCTGGEISFRINSTPYTMRKNDVLICPPDMIVSGIRKSDGMQCRSIAVSPGYFRRILPMVNIDWNAKMAFETHPVFSLDEKDAALFCQYHALLQKKVASNLGKHRTEVIGSLMLAFLYEFGDVVDRFVERQGHTFSSAETIFNNFINMLTDMRPKKRSVSFYAGRLHITPQISHCRMQRRERMSGIQDNRHIRGEGHKLHAEIHAEVGEGDFVRPRFSQHLVLREICEEASGRVAQELP